MLPLRVCGRVPDGSLTVEPSHVVDGAEAGPLALQVGMYWSTAEHSGGLDRVFTELVQQLPAAGIRTVGAVEGPPSVALLSNGMARPFGDNGGRKVARYWRLRQNLIGFVEDDQVDLVVLHFALYGRLILDRIKKPLVVHFQGPWAQEALAEGASKTTARVRHLIEASVYRRAARIIVLSRAFSELLQRDYGISERKIRIVPGHVDLERFRNSVSRAHARSLLGFPTDRPLMVAVRRLKRRMGLKTLVEALAKVVIECPDVLLAIGGTGPLRGELEAQVRALGLERNVRFLGYVAENDLPLLYRAADFSIVPTEALEGFGLVAAESLAAGTPALVTSVGGLPDVVAGLSPNLIFPGADVDAMASRLVSVLRGDISLPTVAECESYARDRFALATAAERVAAVYREALAAS